MLARIAISFVALSFSATLFYAALIYLPQREAARAAVQLEATRVAQLEAVRVEQLEDARHAQEVARLAAQRDAAIAAQREAARAAQREASRVAQLEAVRVALEKLRNNQECRRAALALHKRDQDIITNADFQGFEQMAPTYVYFADEKRCIYKGGFTSKNSIFAYLMDTTTNKRLAEYIRVNDTVTHGDMDRFIEVFSRYFFCIHPARAALYACRGSGGWPLRLV